MPQNLVKHRPLVMALVVRSAKNNLEFQRELIKLAAVAHKQFEIAISDCQFERRVCSMFEGGQTRLEYPALLLFKEDKIWQYAGKRIEFSKELFLDYLSGENFKENSLVFDDDMQGWIELRLGISNESRWFKKYMEKFEEWAEQNSKALFKRLNLYHWSPNTKLVLSLFLVIGPICFIIVGSLALLIISCYNKVAIYFYKRKVAGLKAREAEILR